MVPLPGCWDSDCGRDSAKPKPKPRPSIGEGGHYSIGDILHGLLGVADAAARMDALECRLAGLA